MDKKVLVEKLKSRRYPFKNKEGKWGYTDIFGKVVVQPQFETIEESPHFAEGAKEMDGKPLTFEKSVKENLNLILIIDDNKKIVNQSQLHSLAKNYTPSFNYKTEIVRKINEGFSLVKQDWGYHDIMMCGVVRYGLGDQNGNLIGECKYKNIYPFSEGLARVAYCYMFYLPSKIDLWELGPDYSNFLSIDIKDLDEIEYEFGITWGFIDKQGEEIIPIKYGDAKDFHDGLAAVEGYTGWGYINKQNEEVIPFVFDWADSFEEGYARVLFAGLYYIIDKNGFCYETYEDVLTDNKSKFYL